MRELCVNYAWVMRKLCVGYACAMRELYSRRSKKITKSSILHERWTKTKRKSCKNTWVFAQRWASIVKNPLVFAHSARDFAQRWASIVKNPLVFAHSGSDPCKNLEFSLLFKEGAPRAISPRRNAFRGLFFTIKLDVFVDPLCKNHGFYRWECFPVRLRRFLEIDPKTSQKGRPKQLPWRAQKVDTSRTESPFLPNLPWQSNGKCVLLERTVGNMLRN